MTDADLCAFLGLTPAEGSTVIPRLTPERRAVYERMAEVCDEIHMWEAGVGPKPTGVILCGPKQIRKAGRQ